MRSTWDFGPLLLSLLLAVSYTYAQTLPVYKVQARSVDDSTANLLGKQLFATTELNSTSTNDGRRIFYSSDGTKRIELDTISGGVWVADESKLWKADQNPKLPDNTTALKTANEFLVKNSLLPVATGPIKLQAGTVGGSFMTQETGSTGAFKRQEYQLDVTVSYEIALEIQSKQVPIVGGGGKFQIMYGDSGKVIGYTGLWRNITASEEYKAIPQDTADKNFLASTGKSLESLEFKSTLAYYSAPYGVSQESLYPVYVYEGTFKVGKETLQLRPTYYPASEFGPFNTTQPTEEVPRKNDTLQARTIDDSTYEVGIEWLGHLNNLPLSPANARGFRNRLLSDSHTSWRSSFDWGDKNVWYNDWADNDDIWVDNVDFVYYSGHANLNGWVTYKPGTDTHQLVSNSLVGPGWQNPGDLWGQRDLDWLVVSACGPLQDERYISGGGNVFDRWRGAFDGLHIMFAYGSSAYDSDREGPLFAKYAQEGYNLIDAWLRATWETQPSKVIPVAMWATGPNGDSRQDHLPGHGYISGDNVGVTQDRWIIWRKV